MRPEDVTLWRTPQAWERVAAGAQPPLHEQEAVKLLLPGEQHQAINRHVLAVGDRTRLTELADEFFLTIKKGCGFGRDHDWDRQRQWLTALFAQFFAADCHVGWVSLTTERRPSHARSLQDFKVTITDDPGSIPPTQLFPATDVGRGRSLQLFPGGHALSVPTAGLHFHDGGEKARSRAGQLFLIHSPRTVNAPSFGVHNHSYCEFWACLGLPGRDEGDLERLARRQIPAVPRDLYRAGPDRLRVNPMLSLFKVDLRRGTCTYFGVEIHRESGGVLDLRTTCAPLDATIVMAALVERTAIARTLIHTKSPTMNGTVVPMPKQPVLSERDPPHLRFHARPGHPLEPVPEDEGRTGTSASDAVLAQFLSNVEAWIKNAWNLLGTSRPPAQTGQQSRGYFEVYPALPFPGCILPVGIPEAMERETEQVLAAVMAESLGEREIVRETAGGACRIRIVFYRARSAFETGPQYANALNKLEAALSRPLRKRADVMNPLRFFWAVAEAESFSGAGRRLYPGDLTRTQQVKKGVQKLTRFLGIGPLTSVGTNGVFEKLSDSGQALHEYLKQRIELSGELNARGPERPKRV